MSVLGAGDHVRSLLGRYCDLVDAGDWDAVGALFVEGRLATEDGVALATGAAEVAAFYRRGTRLHDGSPRTKHLVGNTQLRELDSGAVEARSSYVVVQAASGGPPLVPIIAGRYVDTFSPPTTPGGDWRWTERRFAVDLVGDLAQHLTWELRG